MCVPAGWDLISVWYNILNFTVCRFIYLLHCFKLSRNEPFWECFNLTPDTRVNCFGPYIQRILHNNMYIYIYYIDLNLVL